MSEHQELMEGIKIIEALQHKILNSINYKDPAEVLTISMIAEQYHVSKAAIHNNMNQGLLKFHKIGSSTRFYRSEVDQWLKK